MIRTLVRIGLLAGLFVSLAFVWRAGAQIPFPPTFATPLAGVTKATISAPIINATTAAQIHTIKASFPTAVAQVNGIQVQVEASYGPACSTANVWFPLGLPITTAFVLLNSNQVYGIASYYGAYPCIRVNSVLPVSPAMTVYYWADPVPGPPAQKQTDRYTF